MQIFNSTYYIFIFILCKLFFQNLALEDNARSEDKDSPSLVLIQNDESLRNFVKRDAINSPITEIKETENLEKRETKKSKKKVVKKKKSKKSIKKKLLKNKTKKPSKKKTKKSSSKKPKKTTKKRRTTKRRRTTKFTTTTSTTTSTTFTTTTTKPDEFSKWKSLLYLAINNLRFEYQAKKLIVNNTLADLAQFFSDVTASKSFNNLNVKSKNKLKLDDSIGVLFYHVKVSDEYKPLSKWTFGAPFIDFRYPERFPAGGDFTLLIWSSSTQIGCGISKSSSKSTILTICLIYPKGNIKGQFAENIHSSIWKTDHPRLIIKKSR
uniref:SCP domain-containing protein n=1 Tax=Strongyloides venezuelensis TaxID=75913 RepID=A0A0K0FJ98_STRVS